MPYILTLEHATTKFKLMPGLRININNKINNFNDKSKECILYADEMILKTSYYYNISKDEIGFNQANDYKTYNPAEYALICTIRGLNIN